MTTRLLCTLLLIFTATLPRAAADEWVSEEFRCAVTIPTQESWSRGARPPLPFGEVIFHATSMVSAQGFVITYVAEMPSSDIRNEAVQKRIKDLLESQSWEIESSSPMVWKDRPFLEYIARRTDVVSGKRLLGVSRVTPRGRSLYVLTAYGKGEADRARDPEFMRVMETFRFIEATAPIVEKPEGPSARHYRFALLGAAGAAALLALAFAVLMFLSRQGEEGA